MVLLSLVTIGWAKEDTYDGAGETWSLGIGSEEGGSGSSYMGIDIADVTTERLSALKLKEEHGAEITMVDQDAPAGKAGLQEHDVIVSLNGASVESAAQLRRMIKETPPGRVVSLGISRDGQPLTIKVQLADRRKAMSWTQNKHEYKFEMPEMPPMPEFDVPVSVIVVHSSLRSGLAVENITPQLGEFFGVKDGRGVLVRSVEKGSRGEKAGFRAGDVIVKVNNQPVRDASDFTHALRGSANNSASVTVMREKREQNLTLTLPEAHDSGMLLEESVEAPEISVDTEVVVDNAQEEMARLRPQMEKAQREVERANEAARKAQEQFQSRQAEIQERLQEQQERIQEQMQEQQDRLQDQLQDQQEQLQDRMEEQQEQLQGQQDELQDRIELQNEQQDEDWVDEAPELTQHNGCLADI
jgi:membrane-associated protease RseP (regulator of RpoE activity)